MFVAHDWQVNCGTVQISMAATSPRWASPSVIRGLLSYCFNQLGVNKAWTATPHTNTRAIRFNKGIGFRQEATLRHHFGPNVHAVICSMIKTEWEASRWYAPDPYAKAA